jgi:hypothetical protein
MGWHPLQELLEEIHEGDPCMRTYWPSHYVGLEPLDKKRRDWKRRYAAAFQVVPRDMKASDSVNLGVSPNVSAATRSISVSDDAALREATVEPHKV